MENKVEELNYDELIIKLLLDTVNNDIKNLSTVDLIKKYYFINGIEQYYNNKITLKHDDELESCLNDYLNGSNIICNDNSFVNKMVKVKTVAKPIKKPKKGIKVIEKDENGNVKEYTSMKTCLWSKFKSYHYKCYKDQFGDKAERKEFNKLCAKYWNDLNDIEKLNYIKNKIEINWVEVAAL